MKLTMARAIARVAEWLPERMALCGVECIPHVEGTYYRAIVARCYGESELIALAMELEQYRAVVRQESGPPKDGPEPQYQDASCHMAPEAWRGMVYRSGRAEDAESLDSARHLADVPARRRTESPGYLGMGEGASKFWNDTPGAMGASCVATRRGMTYRVKPNRRQKRRLQNLVSLVASGEISPDEKLELLELLKELAKLL